MHIYKEVACPDCNGYGFVQHWDITNENGTYGSGGIWSEVCSTCNGSGSIQQPITNSEWVRGLSDADFEIWLRNLMLHRHNHLSGQSIREWLQMCHIAEE